MLNEVPDEEGDHILVAQMEKLHWSLLVTSLTLKDEGPQGRLTLNQSS